MAGKKIELEQQPDGGWVARLGSVAEIGYQDRYADNAVEAVRQLVAAIEKAEPAKTRPAGVMVDGHHITNESAPSSLGLCHHHLEELRVTNAWWLGEQGVGPDRVQIECRCGMTWVTPSVLVIRGYEAEVRHWLSQVNGLAGQLKDLSSTAPALS